LRRPIRNSNNGSNRCDIGNRRPSVNSIYIVRMVWPPKGVPEMPIVAVKAMMPWPIPAVGIPMELVIWSIWIGSDG
jgi:hypothetical protein